MPVPKVRSVVAVVFQLNDPNCRRYLANPLPMCTVLLKLYSNKEGWIIHTAYKSLNSIIIYMWEAWNWVFSVLYNAPPSTNKLPYKSPTSPKLQWLWRNVECILEDVWGFFFTSFLSHTRILAIDKFCSLKRNVFVWSGDTKNGGKKKKCGEKDEPRPRLEASVIYMYMQWSVQEVDRFILDYEKGILVCNEGRTGWKMGIKDIGMIEKMA